MPMRWPRRRGCAPCWPLWRGPSAPAGPAGTCWGPWWPRPWQRPAPAPGSWPWPWPWPTWRRSARTWCLRSCSRGWTTRTQRSWLPASGPCGSACASSGWGSWLPSPSSRLCPRC
ncbi:unnamed protein product, partial [Ixodes persulcatus]